MHVHFAFSAWTKVPMLCENSSLPCWCFLTHSVSQITHLRSAAKIAFGIFFANLSKTARNFNMKFYTFQSTFTGQIKFYFKN